MEQTAIEVLPELVKKQLQHLLDQEELKRSPILAKFLAYVVTSKLEGREDEIKDYTIGVKALGRPPGFNPQVDAVVRIHAGRLRRILIQHYYGAGKDDLIVITIPKGTYIPSFDVNRGKTDRLTHYMRSQTEINGKAKVVNLPKADTSKPVLAVLPFHDLSPEQSNNSFLTALGEQLSTELARFENIAVISYYATRQFGSSVQDLKNIKNEVGIDYILTGSVRLLNGVLRLNIQLMIVDSGNILWTESYLRHKLNAQNSFDIQDEIVQQVANVVADDHGMISTLNRLKPWQNHEERGLLHDAIIQYFDYTYDYDSKKFAATLRVIENAYRWANNNVLIVSILAKLYLDQYAAEVHWDPELLARGKDLAARAVQLDPRSQHAQKAFAWGLILSGEKEKSVEAMDRCIALNSTASSVLGNMGLGMICLGDYKAGHSMLSRSLELNQNPSACAKLGLAIYHFQNNNYEESNKWLDRLSPFDIPLSALLKLSIKGNMEWRSIAPGEMLDLYKEDALSIIQRIIFDPKLIKKIVNGWKLAGFKPTRQPMIDSKVG